MITDMTKRLTGLYRFLTFNLADESLSPDRLISVSIEKGQISFAYGTRLLSRIKIKAMKRYSIEDNRYPHPGELISFLRLFISETGASRSDIALSIPKTWAVIRTVEFPISVNENLSGAISCEMDRLTPFTSEDAFYDFKVLSEDSEMISLMLVAVKADSVRPYINVLNENGFGIERMTVDLSAIGTLCRYKGEDASEFILLRVDDRGYECGLFINGLLHEAYANELTGTDAERVKYISSDVISLTETARTIERSPQIMMLLIGNSSIKEQLESATGMSIKIVSEAKHGYQEGEGYTATAGLIESLWKDAKAVNLLKRGVTKKQRPPYILTTILLLAFLISLVFYIIAPLRVEGNRIEDITRQIAAKEEDVRKTEALKKEVELLSSEISTINNFKDSALLTLNILKELTSILPQNAWLTGLRIKENTLEIDGYATSATELLPALDASAYFDRVEFASPTVRDRVMNSDRFRIRMQIEGGDNINAKE